MLTAPFAAFGLEQLTTGLFPGATPESVPFWVSAQDVVFDGAGVIPTQGYRQIVEQSGLVDSAPGLWDAATGLVDALTTQATLTKPNSDPVRGVHQQVQSDGRRLIVWGTETALYRFDGGVFNATRASGAYTAASTGETTVWSFAQWGDWVLATNGRDTPQVLKSGETQFRDLANFPAASAAIVRVLGAHALFFNLRGIYAPAGVIAAGNQFVWCKQDDVETWNPRIAPTAGELTVRDAPGAFICVEPLGASLIAYTAQTAHIITLDPTFIFTAQRGATGLRIAGKDGVAVMPDAHYFIHENGMFATDGLTMAPVGYPKLGDWLRVNVDWTQRERVCAFVNMRQNLVKWGLPQANGSIVLTLHSLNQTLSFETSQFTAAMDAVGALPPVVGRVNGDVVEVSGTPSAVTPELVTKPLALSGRDAFSYLDLLVLRHEGAAGSVQWRVGDTEAACVAASWSALGTLGAIETELVLVRETVYVQFRLQFTAGISWKLSNLEVLGKKAGRRY